MAGSVAMVPWTTIITGAVGIAGIGGTLLAARWQTAGMKRAVAAEDERAVLAEKRRVYAAAISALSNGVSALSKKPLPDWDELNVFFVGIGAAIFEVWLIANEEVTIRAASAWHTFSEKDFALLAEKLGELIGAMRSDLGAQDVDLSIFSEEADALD